MGVNWGGQISQGIFYVHEIWMFRLTFVLEFEGVLKEN